MTKGRMPTRDPHEGDVVYSKYRHPHAPLTVDTLGRITKIEGQGVEGMAQVQWLSKMCSTHHLRDLVSVTQKLVIAKHDVQRFSALIAAIEQKEQEDAD